MKWIQYWPLFEAALIIGVFAVIIWSLWRSMKRRARPQPAPRPATLAGKFRPTVVYILRLLGVGVGSFLAVALVVMVERNIFSVITETAPSPSQVDTPADLPFDVEEVTFLSEDGLRVAGWYVPPENGALVILLHGYGGNRTAMLWHAEQLTQAGYGVLMYDERASGESEGTYRSYGWEDPRDVAGALDFLNGKPEIDPEKIGIAGCSIGGQIALQGAAYYPQLGAVWADGASSVRARDITRPTNPANLIYPLLVLGNYTLDWMFEVKLGIDAPAPMIEIIADIAPRPIMLVGSGIPFAFVGSEGDLLKFYAQYAGKNADLWVLPDAGHCAGPSVRPKEYSVRMVEFFDTAFNIQRR
jgi:pimeloyl-ACP methyl ester carboxylesterase